MISLSLSFKKISFVSTTTTTTKNNIKTKSTKYVSLKYQNNTKKGRKTTTTKTETLVINLTF
jgi:hypothetical protein